jgi:hypothetical protein
MSALLTAYVLLASVCAWLVYRDLARWSDDAPPVKRAALSALCGLGWPVALVLIAIWAALAYRSLPLHGEDRP